MAKFHTLHNLINRILFYFMLTLFNLIPPPLTITTTNKFQSCDNTVTSEPQSQMTQDTAESCCTSEKLTSRHVRTRNLNTIIWDNHELNQSHVSNYLSTLVQHL